MLCQMKWKISLGVFLGLGEFLSDIGLPCQQGMAVHFDSQALGNLPMSAAFFDEFEVGGGPLQVTGGFFVLLSEGQELLCSGVVACEWVASCWGVAACW